mgnify:CR=1 FL=1
MRFSRFMYCVRQGFKNIYRNRLFSLASIGTITCCLFLFGVFFSVLYNFQTIIRSAETSVGVTVFFNDDVTEDQILNIKSVVELREEVESVDLFQMSRHGKSLNRYILETMKMPLKILRMRIRWKV